MLITLYIVTTSCCFFVDKNSLPTGKRGRTNKTKYVWMWCHPWLISWINIIKWKTSNQRHIITNDLINIRPISPRQKNIKFPITQNGSLSSYKIEQLSHYLIVQIQFTCSLYLCLNNFFQMLQTFRPMQRKYL